MKVESTTFLCDVAKCRERLSVTYGTADQIAAHLSLVEAGWKVHRSLLGWRHVCTSHTVEDLQ